MAGLASGIARQVTCLAQREIDRCSRWHECRDALCQHRGKLGHHVLLVHKSVTLGVVKLAEWALGITDECPQPAQAQRVRGTRPGMTGAQKARSAAGGYEGPAFDKGPLTPSIGTVCQSQEDLEGELPPYLGGRLVDSLHNHFDRIFGGVE